MSKIEKLSISLPGEMVEMLRLHVARGEYGSASEVVREALRTWQERKDRAHQEVEALRALWQAGIASGPGRFEDIAAIKAAARRKWDQGPA